MSNNTQMDRLDQEIKELEDALAGDTTEQSTVAEVEPEVSPSEVVSATEEPSEPAEPQQKRKYTDWKKRYTELRSHHDSLVYELRSEVASTKERNVALNTKNIEMSDVLSKQASSKSPLSAEERDVLGEDAINALTKMTDQATQPLRDQLANEQALRVKAEKQDAAKAKAAVTNTFLSRLGNLVPDYAELDVDPQFGKWMEQQDEASGYARKVLFKRAEANGDVGRVAEFFHNFKNGIPATKADPLERHVTPTGSAASVQTQPTSEDNKIISWAHVNKFYDDAARGKYKHNMSAFRKEEAIIDKATMEGRVK